MSAAKLPPLPKLQLQAATAAELMTDNPISVRADAGVGEAVALMTDRGFTAAPVIDESGRAIGVVSMTDILIHNREYSRLLPTGDATAYADLRHHAERLPEEMEIEIVDPTAVSEIMTPVVFVVSPDTLAVEVVRTILARRVHHVFVADDQGTLVGVISMGDVLRNLK
jgi:CBS domain-containing protein